MFTLITQTIKKKRNTLLVYVLISIALTWMFTALYPDMAKEADKLNIVFEHYPEKFVKAFDVDMQSFLASLEGFLAAENYSIMWPIILIILVLSLGASSIAGEIEEGTIEILLSQPVSRLKIFFGKYIAGLVVSLSFVWFSIFAVVPLAVLYNIDYQLKNYFTIAILGSLLAIAIFSMSMMFSAAFSTKGKVASLPAGILIFMYAANIIANFKESLQDLRLLSFFHYFDHNKALLYGNINKSAIFVFLGVSIICTLIGALWFEKRDIAV